MLCYRDMTFCTSKDCGNTECPRNTKGPMFDPDEFWKDRVAMADFQKTCKEYKKED